MTVRILSCLAGAVLYGIAVYFSFEHREYYSANCDGSSWSWAPALIAYALSAGLLSLSVFGSRPTRTHFVATVVLLAVFGLLDVLLLDYFVLLGAAVCG